MIEKKRDVLILGGGVIGCAIAYYLSKEGIAVTVLDHGEIGGQSSRAAAGLLAPLGPISRRDAYSEFLLASFSFFPALVPELERLSGLSLGYEQTGSLRLAHKDRSKRLREQITLWEQLGFNLSWLSGEDVRQREPLLSAAYEGVFCPLESQIVPMQLVQAYRLAAEKMGAIFLPNTAVRRFVVQGKRISGIWTEQELFSCDQLIVAVGVWSAACQEWFHVPVPVFPQKGQLGLVLQGEIALKQIVFAEKAYLAPRNGKIIVGSTQEDVGFDTNVTSEGLAWLQRILLKLAPHAPPQVIATAWAGLRPKTPDRRPILGQLQPWENVIIATGHSGMGVTLSPITGQLVADFVRTQSLPEPLQAFSLARFGNY